MAKQDLEGKKRELREKIEKHVNELPLWDLLQIYLYIQWYSFRERSNRLTWKWLLYQIQLHETAETTAVGELGFQMNNGTLLLRTCSWAFGIGSVLALYMPLSILLEIPYHLWFILYSLLFVLSLFLGAFVGYYNRVLGFSFQWMLVSISIFFVVLMVSYVSSYVVTTTLLTDRMVWIPFFYNDFTDHAFPSLAEYLNRDNNYRELLRLQVFLISISSLMYFAAGSAGYAIKAVMTKSGRSSGIAPHRS